MAIAAEPPRDAPEHRQSECKSSAFQSAAPIALLTVCSRLLIKFSRLFYALDAIIIYWNALQPRYDSSIALRLARFAGARMVRLKAARWVLR